MRVNKRRCPIKDEKARGGEEDEEEDGTEAQETRRAGRRRLGVSAEGTGDVGGREM